MAEETTNTNAEVKTDEANDDMASVDRTELASLQATRDQVVELEQAAKDAGYDNLGEYVVFLEDKKYEQIQEQEKATETKLTPAPDTSAKKVPEPVPAGLSEADKAQLNTAQMSAAQAALMAQYSVYRLDQAELPKEDRSTVTQAELTKLITGSKGAMIQSLSKDFGGNYYAAANYLSTIESGVQNARKAGAASEAAKQTAAETATINQGGHLKGASPETTEEKAAAAHKQAQDEIIGDFSNLDVSD